jgi:hypothetical protein
MYGIGQILSVMILPGELQTEYGLLRVRSLIGPGAARAARG